MSHCLVCLEGAASVLNALPLAYRLAREDGSTFVMVNTEHADILAGCSHVSALRWSGGPDTLQQAIKWASETFKHVHVCMANVGQNGVRHKDSWDREAWHNAGYWPHWGTEPLVFDAPTQDWEAFNGVPKAGIHLGDRASEGAFSGIQKALKDRGIQAINLRDRDFKKCYDIIPALNKMDCVVAYESPLVQLCRAVKTPLIYLRPSGDRFHCSVPPPNHVLTLSPEVNNIDTICDSITGIAKGKWPPNDAKLVHTSALYSMKGDNLRRHEVARRSWDAEYKTGKWVDAHLHEKHAPRSSKDVGDPRGVQFMRDLMDHAASKCRNDADIIVLTNCDNSLVPGITERLIFAASRNPIYGHRHDHKPWAHLMQRDEAITGVWYPGWDIFCCRRDWWLKHRESYPDVLVSYSAWDASLYALMRANGGEDMGGLVVHEAHQSFWYQPQNRRNHPGERWNQRLNRPFLRRHGWTEADCKMCA